METVTENLVADALAIVKEDAGKRLALVDHAKDIARGINCLEKLEEAVIHVGTLREYRKSRQEKLKPIKAAAKAVHAQICALEDELVGDIEKSELIINSGISLYRTEQERNRIEEEKRIREENMKAENDRKLREAEAAEASGDKKLAEEILGTPAILPVPHVEAPKVQGARFRTDWVCEVVDKEAVIKAVMEGKAPRSLVVIDESEARKMAKALKEEFKVPGIRVFSIQTPVYRKS